MATKYLLCPELKNVVDALMEKFPNELGHVKSQNIFYQMFSKKMSTILGKIGPVPSRFEKAMPQYDYFLEVHKESWDAADEAKRLYIIFHELLHIPEEGFVNSSKEFRKTKKHDIQDFSSLVSAYGINMEKRNLLKQKIES